MDNEPRPYYNDLTGETVMLTDAQFEALPADSPIRRIQPGEVVPPPKDLTAELSRMEDDGGVANV